MIELKNITKKFGRKKNVFTALDGVSFEIPDGVSVAIVGKSGSGKSTLMHAMSGLDKPQTGAVLVDGEDILQLKPRATDAFRAQTMGFIFQSFFVEARETCYDNVSLSLEMAKVPRVKRKKRILAALAAVDLSDKIKARASELSGGQKQRLAIARAIVNEPKILFADEPTGNLDSTTSKIVEDLLFDYQKEHGATLVLVTHNEELAARCDMLVRIKDGKVVEVLRRGELDGKSSATCANSRGCDPEGVSRTPRASFAPRRVYSRSGASGATEQSVKKGKIQ